MIRFDGGGWAPMGGPICPDLFTLDMLGEADNLRGRVVRAVVWLIDRLWPLR